ncbi:hypothetical protein ES705_38149 [subsurface metagenome]
MEEIRGIAGGAGQTIEQIVALNARGELSFPVKSIPKDMDLPGCTSLAILPEATQSKHTLIAENWDWHGPLIEKSCVILKIKQVGRPNIVQFVEAGMVGKIGVNSAGIGVLQNGLICDKWRIGVPFVVIQRGVLNAETMTDAHSAICGAKRASSGNFLIVHSDGEAIDIEYAPEELNYVYPDDGIIVHSNHFVVNNPNINDLTPCWVPNTIFRRQRAKKILFSERGNITVDTIKSILRDHFDRPNSICWHADKRVATEDQMQTVVSLIWDLTEKRLYIAQGPPCEHEYATLSFDNFL